MKRKLPELEALAEDTKGFFDVLNEGTDLSVALVRASYLDAALPQAKETLDAVRG